MTTIYDIAKKAGVSAATVSKVLNGHSDIGSKTSERVKKISKELGYQPSSMARGLATKKSNTIGIFFQDHLNSGFRHPFLQDILASFKDVIGEKGYDLIFFANNHPGNQIKNFEARARYRNVDGILLLGVPRTDPKLASLSKSKIPCMSIDLDLLGSRAGYLTSDNIGGAIKAIDYLVEMGHNEIAYISDVYATKPGQDRLVGYRTALQQHNLPLHSDWILSGDFSEEGGYTSTMRLLESDNLPTAIFCAGDMMAIGAMKAMKNKNLEIGKDISVMGFDDITLLKHITPRLTTIRQKKDEMGKLAAFELLELMNNPDHSPATITVETELVVRDSVVKLEERRQI